MNAAVPDAIFKDTIRIFSEVELSSLIVILRVRFLHNIMQRSSHPAFRQCPAGECEVKMVDKTVHKRLILPLSSPAPPG